jgi:hypothetical protein
MKKIIFTTIGLLLFSLQVSAHSGGTDKNGGHNCSQKSQQKGLCSGYHYHGNTLVSNLKYGHEGHSHNEFKNKTHEHKKHTIKKV